MSLDPADIGRWWRELAEKSAYDTALVDPAFASILGEDPSLKAEVEKVVGSLQALRAARPDFFSRHDYGFAFDSGLYRASIEPTLQLRLLQAISELDAFFAAQGARIQPRLSGIVARRTWEMSAFAARPLTPAAQPGVPVRFVVAPLGFIEVATLAFHALLTTEAEPALRAIVSIHLSSLLRHDLDPVSLRGTQRRMLESVPLFHSAADYINGHAPAAVAAAWSFALLDFVMFHEVGHIFYEDAPDALNDGDIEDRANEFAANLYGITWGFRAEDMTRRDAPEVMASAGGPLAFIAATSILLTSQAALAKRLAELTQEGRWQRTALAYGKSLRAILQRNEALLRYSLPLQSLLLQNGAATQEQLAAMNTVLGGLANLVLMVQDIVESLDHKNLELALAAAEEACPS